METRHLIDEKVEPNEKLIFSIIGDKQEVWKETMTYLDNSSGSISYVWKYYKDGKCWMLRVLRKKNTVCWIHLLNNTFRIAFYFAERLENVIYNSYLSQELKDQYKHAKAFNKSRAIFIDVAKHADINQIKTLIDLKLAN